MLIFLLLLTACLDGLFVWYYSTKAPGGLPEFPEVPDDLAVPTRNQAFLNKLNEVAIRKFGAASPALLQSLQPFDSLRDQHAAQTQIMDQASKEYLQELQQEADSMQAWKKEVLRWREKLLSGRESIRMWSIPLFVLNIVMLFSAVYKLW